MKKDLELNSYSDLDVNHLALIAIYFLYNQHLSDSAKGLYNETILRALQEEYNLVNNNRNDLIEKINSIEEKYQEEVNALKLKSNDLAQQMEDERIKSRDIIKNMNESNEKLNYEFDQMKRDYESIKDKNNEQLEKEYNQLRFEFNEIKNENELLKDLNTQMFQKLGEKTEVGKLKLYIFVRYILFQRFTT